MKILMVIPQLSMGGAERSFANVARALSHDHEVHCVIFNRDLPVQYDPGVTIHSLDVTGGGSSTNKILSFLQRYRRLRKLAEELSADVVISYLDGANWLNAMLPGGVLRILSQRGSIYEDITASDRRFTLMKRLYPRADKIVALNEYIKEEFSRLLPNFQQVHVIPNFFDIDEITQKAGESAPEIASDAAIFRCCLVGRLAPEKGFHHILHVAGGIKRRGNLKAAFYIIGGGPQLERLKAVAKEEGLSWTEKTAPGYDVYFLGIKENPYPHIRSADALLIGSTAEGGPNVLLEAMICKTLVISTNCPGAPRYRINPNEIIPYDQMLPVYGENGVLLPNFENHELETVIDTWVKSIEEIAGKEQVRSQMVANAYKFVQGFTWARVYDKWKEVVER